MKITLNSQNISPKVTIREKKTISPIKGLYDKKETLILPNISQNIEIVKKEPISKYTQLVNKKMRISMNITKSKITTAFIQNEEEETLKKNRY